MSATDGAASLTIRAISAADASKQASVEASVVSPVPQGAATWYVSEEGDNEEGDGTEEAPFATVGKALEAVQAAYTGGAETVYIVIDGVMRDSAIDGEGEEAASAIAVSGPGYPPIELRGKSEERPGSVNAWSGKRALYVKDNDVTLGPFLTLYGGVLVDGEAVFTMKSAYIRLGGVYVQGASSVFRLGGSARIHPDGEIILEDSAKITISAPFAGEDQVAKVNLAASYAPDTPVEAIFEWGYDGHPESFPLDRFVFGSYWEGPLVTAWYVSALGDDANAGTGAEAPLRTPKEALKRVREYYTGHKTVWPKDGKADAPARIVISGEILLEEAMAEGSAIDITQGLFYREAMAYFYYPPLRFEGDASGGGTLKVSPALANTRVLNISGVEVILGQDLTLTGGNVTGNGGGVAVSGAGTLILDGASIKGNTASGWGGGVYLPEAASLLGAPNKFYDIDMIIRSGTITDNTAFKGGGIYMAGGSGMYEGGAPVLEMTGGRIHGNHISGDNYSGGGAGILLEEMASDSPVLKIGGTARIDQSDPIRIRNIYSASKYTFKAPIVLLDSLGGISGPAAKIELAASTTMNGYHVYSFIDAAAAPILAWEDGLSGPLPVDKFTLGSIFSAQPANSATAIPSYITLTRKAAG